jgi:hypothetical protein
LEEAERLGVGEEERGLVLLLVWCRALRFRASERNGGERKQRTDGLEADFINVDCPYFSLQVDAANVAGPLSTVALEHVQGFYFLTS